MNKGLFFLSSMTIGISIIPVITMIRDRYFTSFFSLFLFILIVGLSGTVYLWRKDGK